MSDKETDYVRSEILDLVRRGNVTPNEIVELRCNSYEWEALIPALTDQALAERTQYALDNCFTTTRRPFSTYNEAVEGLYTPELLRRFSRKFGHEQLAQACKNIGFDLTCGACAEQFFTGASGLHEHDSGCATQKNPDAEKWQLYEREYILPCFRWAKESGFDLSKAVSDNPGKNCVELLVRWLQPRARAAADFGEVLDDIREALGQKETHFLVIADDVKELVQKIEFGGDAKAVLRRIREEPGSGNPRCQACRIEAEIGTEENPHPVPSRFHTCVAKS